MLNSDDFEQQKRSSIEEIVVSTILVRLVIAGFVLKMNQQDCSNWEEMPTKTAMTVAEERAVPPPQGDCKQASSATRLTADLLRQALPACQPQEGSPANTFTDSELQELQAALPNLNINQKKKHQHSNSDGTGHLLDLVSGPPLDWHNPPRFSPDADAAREFRLRVRQGLFRGPTNAVCPGLLQCNLVVLPQGPVAFDFLLFCQRNPKACPLLEVCDVGSACPTALAPGADLRTDCPK